MLLNDEVRHPFSGSPTQEKCMSSEIIVCGEERLLRHQNLKVTECTFRVSFSMI